MHALLALWLSISAQVPPSTSPGLPLKTLVLYENGVGYFERRGKIGHGATAEIPLEAGQLDDTLKSLVVVSEQGVASVEFAPPLAVEAAKAMAGMHGDDEQSLEGLLRALQGVEVVVSQAPGAATRGRVIGVSQELGLPDKEGKRTPEPTLLTFGEGGLSKVPLTQVLSVRPVNASVAHAWTRAVGSTAQQPERERLLVRGGPGSGAVAVGYTTEAPVWRTTYRLLLTPRPRLQGFALVHNDSDEDWSGVKVSLASGRPTSFLFPLAGPRYGRRELISPTDGLDTAPQLSTREAREHLRGAPDGAFGATGVGSGGGGAAGLGSIGTRGHGYGTGSASLGSTITAGVLEDGPTPVAPAAVSEAGDLFLYTVKEPVILAARKSALLPIIDGPTAAERVSVIDAAGVPASALRLQNTTALTLEGGTLSVFTDGAYAGETQLDRVKPNEVRVLKHGEDLDLQLTRSGTSQEEGPVRKARVTGPEGARLLELTRVDRVVHHLELSSRASLGKTVLLELPATAYRVVSGAEEDVRSPGQPRYARFVLEAHADATREVVEEGTVTERIAASALTSGRLDALLAQGITPEIRQTLLAVRAEVARAEAAQARLESLDRQSRELEGDLTRLRENLTAVGKGGAAGAARTLGERLIELDDQLVKLRKEREGLTDSAEAVRRKLLLATR